MGVDRKLIPASSQTVGPYFRIGLEYVIDRMAEVDAEAGDWIVIRGRVLDRDGLPVPDAMLEFWSAEDTRDASGGSRRRGIPDGFRRVGTDLEGKFAAKVKRPAAIGSEDEGTQAPHMMVLVFARGLQRHLITRVYLEDEPGNEGDPVMICVPEERRHTLIGKVDGENVYRWDVVLQGADETVFFAW